MLMNDWELAGAPILLLPECYVFIYVGLSVHKITDIGKMNKRNPIRLAGKVRNVTRKK